MTAKTHHNCFINNCLFISLENPEVDIQPTGVSTFAIRTSHRTDQNCKRASTSPIKKRISKYFFQRFKNK